MWTWRCKVGRVIIVRECSYFESMQPAVGEWLHLKHRVIYMGLNCCIVVAYVKQSTTLFTVLELEPCGLPVKAEPTFFFLSRLGCRFVLKTVLPKAQPSNERTLLHGKLRITLIWKHKKIALKWQVFSYFRVMFPNFVR